jgi:hypothetical protein
MASHDGAVLPLFPKLLALGEATPYAGDQAMLENTIQGLLHDASPCKGSQRTLYI